MPCASISATWMWYSSRPKRMARRSSDHGLGGRGSGEVIAWRRGGVGARGSIELHRSSGDPWLKGLDGLEWWRREDLVGGEQDDVAVAVREACSLVHVVDLDSV
eukprot:3403327-Rhodomonas_salina.1